MADGWGWVNQTILTARGHGQIPSKSLEDSSSFQTARLTNPLRSRDVHDHGNAAKSPLTPQDD